MAITRERKEAQVKELTDHFGKLKAAVLADYHGLSVREMQELRSQLAEQGIDFAVAKNTLFARAAKQAGIKVQELKGPTAIAFGYEDPVTTSKIVFQFTKDHEALEIIGGIVDGAVVDTAMIEKFAMLPGRDELLVRLVGSISGPTRNLASALGATTRNLVYALQAVREAKA